MLTQWGESLSPKTVWTEHPRPHLTRDTWQSLNGPWQYAVCPRPCPRPTEWEGEILVPFCIESALSGVQRRVEPTDRLWYRRTFTSNATNKRTLLHFGAVDYAAAVWINDAFAGTHVGGFDPFTLDVTEFLRTGDNELVVAVDDPTSAADQPRGKQHLKPQGIWYTPVTGIWQTVWLESVPIDNHIAEVRITPDLATASVAIEAMLGRPTRHPELAVELTIRLGETTVIRQMGRPDRTIRISIANPQPWSPQQPVLYDVDVRLVRVANPLPADNDRQATASLWRDAPLRGAREAALYANTTPVGEPLDSVGSYFGMRTIEVGPHPSSGKPTLLLNGAPVFHLGTLDQGWWPDGLHTPPSDAALIHEIEYLKAAGFNTVRKHIKVEPARYYYHCDRLGLLVWQDMPSGFLPAQFVAPNDEDEGLRSSTATQQYELELQRMINGLCPHPCIVIWVLHNEGWGQFATPRLTDRIRALDPTRVINAVSGWRDAGAGDLIDRHDYQSEPTAPKGDGRRALVVGEYGGIGWPIEDHLWNPEMRNWGYQTFHNETDAQAAYALTTQAMARLRISDGICAAIYTQTTDVEGEVNGLLTYDRRVEKFSREWLASVHRPLGD